MVLIVYIMLAILFAMLTAGLYVYTVLDPQVHLIYTFLKCFYLVLFVLWIHKYFTIKFTKLLNLWNNILAILIKYQKIFKTIYL